MSKTINFCGDSFCAHPGKDSWPIILSHLLKYKIIGLGKGGVTNEHIMKSFNPDTDITIFCWTDPHRIYHPTIVLNRATIEQNLHTSKIHAAADQYYKYLHSSEIDLERRDRNLFWFEEKILKKYKGKIIHLFSFLNSIYPFKYGKVIDKPLYRLLLESGNFTGKTTQDGDYPNHMKKETNAKLAKYLYKLLA